MYDLKPDAPAEYRGEFKPIHTNVPGIQICEHLPRQARMLDKFAVVRCVTPHIGGWDTHDQNFHPAARHPSFVRGDRVKVRPPFLA